MTNSRKPNPLKIDWRALHQHFNAVDTQRSIDELVPAWQRGEIPEPRWAPEYIPALQAALEGADESLLIEVLDARRLAHPQLMPLFAELLRRKAQGLSVGRPKKLTEIQEQGIARHFAHVPQGYRGSLMQNFADGLGVSKRTIETAIAKQARKK